MTRGKRWLGVFSSLTVGLGMVVAGGSAAQAAAPGNDAFASAIALPDNPSGSTTGSNVDATVQTGEQDPSSGATASVWWTWTAPSTGTFLFDTCGSNFATGLGIWTGDTLGALNDARGTSVYCYYQGNWTSLEGWEVDATQGVTYRIQVTGADGAMGSIVLRWWSQAAPANDNFGNATGLGNTASGSVTGTNRFATVQAGEPGLGNGGGASVWWTWTPPGTGDYTFDTCGSNFDTVLGIYTGSDFPLTQVAVNDDSCAYQSVVSFTAVAGTPYRIFVAGYDGYEIGDITLNWEPDTAPGNDDFTSAATLPSTTSGSSTGNTRFATTQDGEPSLVDSHSIWWRWTAPASGSVVFDTCGSDAYTLLGAYTGNALGALTLVARNSAGCKLGSMIRFDAVRRTTYSIVVSGQPGDVALHWQTGTAPVNDNLASAAELVGSGGTATGTNMFATVQTGEPQDLGTHTIWYSWWAPNSNPVNFNLCGSTLSKGRLLIYTGNSVDALTQVNAAINYSCGHDSAGFTPTAGTQYYIGVGDYDNGMGGVVLHWPATDGPPTVTGLTATTTSGHITITFSSTGTPAPTNWQCLLSGAKNTWFDCTSPYTTTYRTSAKTVYVHAGYSASGPWGPTASATVTRK